jgi:NADH-ubiquinone oxidoreductase chain 1
MINNNLISNIINILINLMDVLIILLPVLLSVAFMTIIERKQLAAMQRRVGPNTVGYYGILQPFSDALKLILKETVIPSHSNKVLFYLAPVSSLIFSLLGWGIIPFGEGLTISDFSLGVLYSLALSSLGVYGILFAGWSANSKYAFCRKKGGDKGKLVATSTWYLHNPHARVRAQRSQPVASGSTNLVSV